MAYTERDKKTGRILRKAIKLNKVQKQGYENIGMCHECISHVLDNNGYPCFYKDGFVRMHRYIHWKNTGEKPKVVMHLCDNPKCVNPKHLKSGNKLLNARDRDIKGRNKLRYLNTLDIKYIRHWLKTGFKQREIAKSFNIDESTISNIKRGKYYKEEGVLS